MYLQSITKYYSVWQKVAKVLQSTTKYHKVSLCITKHWKELQYTTKVLQSSSLKKVQRTTKYNVLPSATKHEKVLQMTNDLKALRSSTN